MIWVGRMWVGAKQQANQWIARLLGKKVKLSIFKLLMRAKCDRNVG